MAAESCKSQRLFSFGLITDIQYADRDHPVRDYRGVLAVTERAVDFFNQRDLSFVAHLGDIVDQHCVRQDPTGAASSAALKTVMDSLGKIHCNQLHCLIGNHELYNWPREDLCKGIPCPSAPGGKVNFADESGSTYYSFSPAPGWRVVVLDPFEEAVMHRGRGSEPDEALVARATAGYAAGGYLHERFGPSGTWDTNGAVGLEQMQWLQHTLSEAKQQGELVLIMSHSLLHPSIGECDEHAWNYAELLQMVQRSGVVVACLHGHSHTGGFAQDDAGIYHVAFQSPLMADRDCPGPFSAVDVFGDHIELHGYSTGAWGEYPYPAGEASGAKLSFRNLPLAAREPAPTTNAWTMRTLCPSPTPPSSVASDASGSSNTPGYDDDLDKIDCVDCSVVSPAAVALTPLTA
eukprot:TRINITY_DN14426_c0_g2_i1.p1 TRINITY_DN14426_c0_g2~~TRINITY_DN14426_c0_g2_i1.p1  ORF type:complete len:436 (+),score=139.67 TRINITY_DN14426_c0_g2_i1:95-1309(+)